MQQTADGRPHSGAASYFSFGALAGATFVGLWVGGCVMAIPINFVLGGVVGLLVAVVLTLPVSVVLAIVVFPLTRRAQGKLAPTIFNAAILGSAVGTLAILAATVLQAMSSNAAPGLAELRPIRLADLWVIAAGLVGGAAAGITYRALLIYKYPTVLSVSGQRGFN